MKAKIVITEDGREVFSEEKDNVTWRTCIELSKHGPVATTTVTSVLPPTETMHEKPGVASALASALAETQALLEKTPRYESGPFKAEYQECREELKDRASRLTDALITMGLDSAGMGLR